MAETTNLTYGQHLRNQFWNRDRSTARNIGNLAINALRSGFNPIAFGTQAAARAGIANAREGVVNSGWYQSAFGPGAPTGGEMFGPPTSLGSYTGGGYFPNTLSPGYAQEPAAAWNPLAPGAYGPDYGSSPSGPTPAGYGVVALPGMQSAPQVNFQNPASRFGTTIASGQAAQNFVSGMQSGGAASASRAISHDMMRRMNMA